MLSVELPWLDGLVRAKPSQPPPVVLTREEVRVVLSRLDGVSRLMGVLLYGAGLRLLECCHLRVKDVDFGTNQIVVRDGKGAKDRLTMLPAAVKTALVAHIERVRVQHHAARENRVRIISARRATSRERRQYGEGIDEATR